MAEDHGLRPVSGEIVSRAARGVRPAAASRIVDADIVDAEFETLGPQNGAGNTRAGNRPHRPQAAKPDTPQGGMTVLLRAGADRAAGGAARLRPSFWMFGVIVVLAAFWASGGHALFGRAHAVLPRETPAPALRVDDLTTRLQNAQGRHWLVVEGQVVNTDGAVSRDAPVLLFTINGKDGKTRRHLLDTGMARIAPGEALAFASRLAAPLSGVASLSVTIEQGKAE
ncbi:hypothetical protein [Mesorhizobium xinjiangense]|uniref:hypothetical protein n=1 Tax=Mesorhizobium xinjiangense TaxID=2678685 RepID=UPI0012ECD08C|nr:hypothetical protein [Mesorhizobium xinjiangense]